MMGQLHSALSPILRSPPGAIAGATRCLSGGARRPLLRARGTRGASRCRPAHARGFGQHQARLGGFLRRAARMAAAAAAAAALPPSGQAAPRPRHQPRQPLWPPPRRASAALGCMSSCTPRSMFPTCFTARSSIPSLSNTRSHLGANLYMPLSLSVSTPKEAGTHTLAGTGARSRRGRRWQRFLRWKHLCPWRHLQQPSAASRRRGA